MQKEEEKKFGDQNNLKNIIECWIYIYEIITVDNSVRSFLGHFWAQLGDKQPLIFVS